MAPDTTTPDAGDRAQWGSRIGFILSAMGSAIGFGSIARFPMNAANNGGAAFVLLYAGIMLLVGVPLLIAEFSMGRSSQKNTVGTFKKLSGNPRTKWRGLGVFYFLLAAFFLSWYATAAGWVFKAAFASITGSYFDDPAGYFFETIEGPDALFWHFAVMAVTLAAVVLPISKGIEKINLVLLPLLFVIVLGLAMYAATLDGVADGYRFYLSPDFSAITVAVVIAAIGQAFFSLSLGQGAMMTYASYLSRKTSLAENASIIAGSTLVFAFTCGFMIFPMLAAYGLLNTGAAGLDLILGPLPIAFAGMGAPVGNIVGFLFFAGTLFAAFTSAVSLTEPAIAYTAEERGWDRKRAAILVCTLIYIVGIAAALSKTLLDFEGGLVTDTAVIAGGLGIALYVGWVRPKKIAKDDMDECEKGIRLSWYTYPLVKFVMPAVLIVLLFFAMFGTPCPLSGDAAAGGLVERMFDVGIVGCRG